jgi:hypothetical protein
MSDISAKRAEEVAYNLQLSGVSGSTWRATEVEASNMLRALAAERDTLRAALREIKRRTQDAHPMSYVADYWRIAKEALGEKE